MQVFSNPADRNNPHRLPDIEVFQADGTSDYTDPADGTALVAGHYWWVCLPGCLPVSDAYGPFTSADDAAADAVAFHADYFE